MSACTPAGHDGAAEIGTFIVPIDAPPWCDVLAMGEAEARRVIEPHQRCTIGPRGLLRRRRYAAAVECRRSGAPFVTFGADGRARGIFGSWTGAAIDLVRLAREFETGSQR